MRKAKLEDVENADSWDSEAARVLMGSGCLYVVRIVQEDEHIEVDEKNTCDDDDDIHFVPVNQKGDVDTGNNLPSQVGKINWLCAGFLKSLLCGCMRLCVCVCVCVCVSVCPSPRA